MLHYTQPCLLNSPELVFGPYLLQSQWRQIYKFVDFWLKFDIFSRFGEDNKRFGVMNIFGIPGKYIEKIKNITQALAISELHFHLFFYRNRCVRTSSLRGCSLRSQPLRSRVSRLRRLTSCLHKFHPNDILFTCINFAAQRASRYPNSIVFQLFWTPGTLNRLKIGVLGSKMAKSMLRQNHIVSDITHIGLAQSLGVPQ